MALTIYQEVISSGTSTTLTTTNTIIGNLGTGSFTQNGTDSSHTVSETLTVGAGGSGTYTLYEWHGANK